MYFCRGSKHVPLPIKGAPRAFGFFFRRPRAWRTPFSRVIKGVWLHSVSHRLVSTYFSLSTLFCTRASPLRNSGFNISTSSYLSHLFLQWLPVRSLPSSLPALLVLLLSPSRSPTRTLITTTWYVLVAFITFNADLSLQPYKADTDTGDRGTQYGYNICNSTTEGQTSLCQTAMISALDG
jgi:hypothetical protein